MKLDFCGERACNKRSHKHDEKRNGVAAVVGLEGQPRIRKEKVEYQDARNGQYKAVNPACCRHRSRQHAQDINCNNICFTEAQPIK